MCKLGAKSRATVKPPTHGDLVRCGCLSRSWPPGYEPIEPPEELDEECDETARPVPTGPPIPMCNVIEDSEDLLCNAAIEMAKQAAAAGGCTALCEKKIKGTSKSATVKRAACITGCVLFVETAFLCE